MQAFKEYSRYHLGYSKLIQRRNMKFRLKDERYYKMRGKLEEWLDYSIKKSKEEQKV